MNGKMASGVPLPGFQDKESGSGRKRAPAPLSRVANDLTIPHPGKDLIPDGWWKTTVVPWADEQTNEKDLQKGAAKLAALQAAMKAMGLDAMELMKGRRYIELDWGKLLGKGKDVKTGPGRNASQVGATLERHERNRFRQLAVYPKQVMKQLESADKEDQCTRTALLRVVKNAKRKTKREEEREQAVQIKGYIQPDLRIGDFREVLADIPDGSVDLILTDPPYGKKAIVSYRELGIFAARVLKPDGSLLAYSGQSVLGEVLSVLSESLRYWWTLCMQHSGTGQKLPGKWVFVDWKPIVWFVKERRRGKNYIKDLLHGEIPDKTDLAWAQGAGEVQYLIEELSAPSNVIVDPFAGTGQWGDLAGKLGRRWIGADLQAGGGLNK